MQKEDCQITYCATGLSLPLPLGTTRGRERGEGGWREESGEKCIALLEGDSAQAWKETSLQRGGRSCTAEVACRGVVCIQTDTSWEQAAAVGAEASPKFRVPNTNFPKLAVSPPLFLEWRAEAVVGSDTECGRGAPYCCGSIKLFRPQKSPGLQSRELRVPERPSWGAALGRKPHRPGTGRLSRFLPRGRT